MKFEHVLIMHSAKSKGKRIAYHKIIREVSDYNKILDKQEILKDEFPDVLSFSTHFIETCDEDVGSVEIEDDFFQGVEYIASFELFKDEVENDLEFNVDDLMRLALMEKSYSKLYLQNVMFSIAEEYMQTYKLDLIDENFKAYEHGPVLDSVLDRFAHANKEEIASLSSKDRLMMITRIKEMGLGDSLLPISNKVIRECSAMNRTQLYQMGHKEHGPWDIVYNGKSKNTNIISNHLMMI